MIDIGSYFMTSPSCAQRLRCLPFLEEKIYPETEEDKSSSISTFFNRYFHRNELGRVKGYLPTNVILKVRYVSILGEGGSYKAVLTMINHQKFVIMIPRSPLSTSRFFYEQEQAYLFEVLNFIGGVTGIQDEIQGKISVKKIPRSNDTFEYFSQKIPFSLFSFYEGGSLKKHLRTLSVIERCEIIKQIVFGVSYFTLEKITHGDIKPSNILIERTPPPTASIRACIADWSGAKIFDLSLKGMSLFDILVGTSSGEKKTFFQKKAQTFTYSRNFSLEEEVQDAATYLDDYTEFPSLCLEELFPKECARDIFCLGETIFLILLSLENPLIPKGKEVAESVLLQRYKRNMAYRAYQQALSLKRNLSQNYHQNLSCVTSALSHLYNHLKQSFPIPLQELISIEEDLFEGEQQNQKEIASLIDLVIEDLKIHFLSEKRLYLNLIHKKDHLIRQLLLIYPSLSSSLELLRKMIDETPSQRPNILTIAASLWGKEDLESHLKASYRLKYPTLTPESLDEFIQQKIIALSPKSESPSFHYVRSQITLEEYNAF